MTTAPATPPPPAAPLPTPTAGSLLRQFVQLLALILSLLLVVRTVFVEPFGVPTGSMAPALIGNHREIECPHCSAPIKVGAPNKPTDPYRPAVCPNCGHGPLPQTQDARDILGDRLLVDKAVFTVRPPRRWEVAVFYNQERNDDSRAFSLRAVGAPGEPFVKRVVGLPGEDIQLHDGDVYADGVLCRKTLSEVWQTAIPVFAMNYVPTGDGWKPRWAEEAVVVEPKLPPLVSSPRGTATVDGSELRLDASAAPNAAVALTYHHRNLKTGKDEDITSRLGYNGKGDKGTEVHDFALRCEVEATAGSGMFAVRLGDGADFVTLELPVVENTAAIPPDPAVIAHDGGQPPKAIPNAKLIAGRKHRLEFAFVDRRATASLDGTELASPLDLPPVPKPRKGFPAGDRKGTSRPLRFGVRGAVVAIRDLTLFRDIHYRADGTRPSPAGYVPQHGLIPHRLGADEFFLLGDNVGNSSDSREWANPGVPLGAFIGKPFLIHQPLRAGRVTVNGNDRQFTTVDWDRMRLLD